MENDSLEKINFLTYQQKEERCILISEDNKYFAKITIIYEDLNKKYAKIGRYPGFMIENEVYDKIGKDSQEIIPKIIHINRGTKGTKHKIIIDNRLFNIDFRNWIKTINETHIGYSFFIVETCENYNVLFQEIHGMTIKRAEQIFINTMKKIIYLNDKYDFIHGDLKTDNVLINESNDIKLIDFDLSRVGTFYSENQKYFTNYSIIHGMDKNKGIIYDLYRFYLSFYIWDICEIFKGVEMFEKLNKIIDRVVTIYKTQTKIKYENYIFNNPEYFGEWILNTEITRDYVVNFINTYEPIDLTSVLVLSDSSESPESLHLTDISDSSE